MSKNSIQQFISKEAIAGIVLFLSTVLAVIISNSSQFSDFYFKLWNTPLGITFGELSISMTLTYWIDDALMSLFFLMVGLEIKKEILIGELSTIKQASFPIVGAIGGMLIPALIYIAFNQNNPMGFGIPMATDIAFALGILMLLGKRVNPAIKIFLVALAVVDDLGAIIVVAVAYTSQINFEYFIPAGLTYLAIWLLNIKGVKSVLPYIILGIALWIFIHAIGIHATISGVLLAFAIPIKSKLDEINFVKNSKEAIDIFEKNIDPIPVLNRNQIESLETIKQGYDKVQNPLLKLEHNLYDLNAFVIMPLFAFSNAGVLINFSTMGGANLSIVLGVIFGLIIGKPIGIFGLTYLSAKLNIIKKPDSITWFEVFAVGFLGGIGFTMSIFITHLAFANDQQIIDAVKLGVFIASFIASIIGISLILLSNKKVKYIY